MATETYIPLAEITLVADAFEVNFESISQDYSDLVLVMEFKGSGGNAYGAFTLNGDTGSNYTSVFAYGDGSSAASSTASSTRFAYFAATTTDAYLERYDILDYSATDKHKTILGRGDRANYRTHMVAGRWANTSAVTSITLFPISNSYAAGSTFKLFGIHGEAV